MKKVVMYTGNPCPYCVYARALLDSKKIPYKEIKIVRLSQKNRLTS